MVSLLFWEIVKTFEETVIFVFTLPKILMWLTLMTTTNNNKFISTVYRQLKEFTKNVIIKNNTNYTQEPMAVFNNYSTSSRWIWDGSSQRGS